MKQFRISLFVATLVLALVAGLGCSTSEEANPASGPMEKTTGDTVRVEVNSKAPAFAAKTLGGKVVKLADYVGNHVILLEFWSIFCKSCIQEMGPIKELYFRHRDDGLAVLSINTDVFSDRKISGFLQKAGIKFDYPILRDRRQDLVKAFNVELLPVTVIIDRSGWIRLYQEGYKPGDEDDFEDIVVKLLKGDTGRDVTLAPREGVTSIAPAGTGLVGEGNVLHPTRLPTVGGNLAELGLGKPAALFFWSLYCLPCREEFPQIVDFAEKVDPLGANVYSVNVDSKWMSPRIEKFLNKYTEVECIPDWPENHKTTLNQIMGVRATPTAILLDGKGRIILSMEGKFDAEEFIRKIKELSGYK